jgi:hypothetical protein
MARKKAKQWYEKKEFQELRREWYGKLKKSGFEDIEYFDKNGEVLPVMKGYNGADAARFYKPDAAEFYRLAVHFTNRVEEMFGTRSWKYKAWVRYADGVGILRIAKGLKRSYIYTERFIKEMVAQMLREVSEDIDQDKKYKLEEENA